MQKKEVNEQERYSPGPHFVDELQGEGMQLEPSDSQSPNVNLNYSASPMPPSGSQEPPRNRQQQLREESKNRQLPGGGTFYANSPSLLSGQEFVHSSTYAPIQTSPGMEMSQGTAGFGGGGGGMAGMSSSIQSIGGGLGEMGSYDGLPPRQMSSSMGGRDNRSPTYHLHPQAPPGAGFSQSSMGSSSGKFQHHQKVLPQQPHRVSAGSSSQQPSRTGSAPIPGGGRFSSPGAGGSDSLAHYSLVSGQQHPPAQQQQIYQQQNMQQQKQQQQQALGLQRQLAEKVRSQAQRLQKLEQYKILCEKRLVELVPQHPIPVLSQHLGIKIQRQISQDPSNAQQQIQFEELKQQISVLQSQKMQFEKLLNQRNSQLQQLKQQNQLLDKNFKSNTNFFDGTLGTNNQQKINELNREKKQIYENLQAETLRCQELRIHNEILKESLESNIERLGLGDLLRQSTMNRQKLGGSVKGPNSRKLNSNQIDLFLELTKIKAQSDAFRSQKMKVEARNAELLHQLNKLQDNHGKNKQEQNQLSHDYSECKQANMKLESEKNALLEYIQEKVQLHEKLAGEVDFVKNQNSELMNEKNDLEKLTKDLEQEFNEQQDKVKRLDGQKKSFERQNQSLKGQVSMLNEQLRKSDEKLQICQKELSSIKQTMQEQDKQLGTARSQLQNHRSQLQKVIKTSTNDKEQLQKRLKSQEDKLSSQLRQQKEQEQLTENQITNLKNRLQATQQKYTKAKQNLHKAEKDCFEKKDQLQRIANERHLIQNEKQRLQSTLNKVKSELDTNRIRVQQLNHIEEKYQSAIQQLKDLQRDKMNLSQKYSKVQDQFNNTNSQLLLLRSDLQKSERYMMQTERQKKNQIHQIKQALVQKHKNHNDILQDLNVMRRDIAAKDEQISVLNGEVRMYKQELQDLYGADKRAYRLAQDYQQKNKQAKSYEKNMSELNEKLNTVRGQLDGTQFQSGRLKRQNQNLKERMKALQMDIEEMVRDRTRMMDQDDGRKKKKKFPAYRGAGQQVQRKSRQTSPIVVVEQNGQDEFGAGGVRRSSAGKRSSPLRNASDNRMFMHQRQSSQIYRHSGDLLAGVNACLESIRQFIRKVKSTILSAPQISIKFKDLVESMGRSLNRRIIDNSQVQQAIYRIDEWLQESMHEFQRIVSLFPTKDDHKRHLTERSSNIQNRDFSNQKQTRFLAFDSINERDDDIVFKKQHQQPPNSSRHNQRINNHIRRLTRKTSLPGPNDVKNQQHRSQNNSLLLPPSGQSSDNTYKLNQLKKQKEQLSRLTMRIIDSIPTPQLRNICRSIIQGHQNIINIAADRARIQQKLMSTESTYKMQIRKQKSGTTSEEGIQLRKQVEMMREQFQNCKQHQQIAEKKMQTLEEELKHLQDIEKRRSHLGLENQKNVAKLKMELQDMRGQIMRLQRAKQDAMRLSEKLTEERKFLDKELISLRSQIVGMNFNAGVGGGGNSINDSSRVMYQGNVGQHGQIPSFGGGASAAGVGGSQINKSQSSQNLGGEFGDFMPKRTKYQGRGGGGGQITNRSLLSRQNQSQSRSRSPAAQKLRKALDESKKAMAHYSPGGAKQLYQRIQRRQADQKQQEDQPNRNLYGYPTLRGDASSEQYSNMSPMQTRFRSQEYQLDSESSPPKNSLKERLDNMKQAIQERLMDSQERNESENLIE